MNGSKNPANDHFSQGETLVYYLYKIKTHILRKVRICLFWTSKQINMWLNVLFSFYGEKYKFPGVSDSKESAYNAGGLSSIPGSERSPGEGHGNALHGVAKSQTQLSH